MNEGASRRRWWTQDEDQILQEEVKNQREYTELDHCASTSASTHRLCIEVDHQQGSRNWSAIAERLPGRSNKDCRKRWTKISLSSRKGTWSGAEDHLLRKAVAAVGFQWTKVAEMVGSRHPDQCAKRWHHSLDPNVKRGPWALDEDTALLDAVKRVGRDWKEIGRELFPSRSTTDIKNRYVILSRRRGLSMSSTDNSSTIHSGACSVTPFMSSRDASQMDLLPPEMDVSLVTTPCGSGIFNLPPDDLNMPFASNLPSYLFETPPNLQPTDIPACNPNLTEVYPSTADISDWTTFDTHSLPPFNLVSPPSTTSEIESCDPSLLVNGSSLPDTPSVTDGADTNAPSTLVLEDLRPETVNLVIDTLLRTNSKFGMRLYNTGS